MALFAGKRGARTRQVLERLRGSIAREHQAHYLVRDGFGGHFIKRLQHVHGALGFGFGAIHLELLMPVRDAYLQRGLDAAQMRVGGAA